MLADRDLNSDRLFKGLCGLVVGSAGDMFGLNGGIVLRLCLGPDFGFDFSLSYGSGVCGYADAIRIIS